jgi:hypothetical protein
MLHLSNASHAVNHFQNQMMAMLYPSIMAELGLSYTAVGALAAVCSVLNSISQGMYGLLTPFVSRCKLLGDRMLQLSLALSCVGSLWVAHLGPGRVTLFTSLLLYSAFTSCVLLSRSVPCPGVLHPAFRPTGWASGHSSRSAFTGTSCSVVTRDFRRRVAPERLYYDLKGQYGIALTPVVS